MTCPTSRCCERRARHAPAIGPPGFTLLELMLVVGIMSLALGLGMPRISAVRATYLAAEEAREVAGFIRAARLDAVANRSTIALTTAPDRADALELRRPPLQAGWSCGNDAPISEAHGPQGVWDAAVVRRLEVSGAIRLETAGAGILFFANGSSTGGEVVLLAADGRSQHRFRIDPGTGAVVAQRRAGS